MPFEKMEKSSGNVLGFKVVGTISKDDYATMVPQVESLIASEGTIRLLCDLTDFKWEEVSAWGADMRFGREHKDKIEKLAIVGDSRWQSWLSKLADPFFAGESQYFEVTNEDQAWDWLKE